MKHIKAGYKHRLLPQKLLPIPFSGVYPERSRRSEGVQRTDEACGAGRGLFLFIFLFSFNPLFSQKDTSQYYNKTLSNNNFSIELGGKALAYSIGYERTIYKSKKLLLTGNINVTSEAWLFEGSVAIIPISISTLIGEKRNKLLVGLDATTAINYSRSDIEFIQLSIGYRRYFKKGNSLSIALTLVAFSNSYVILPMFSINYNFKL